MMLTARVNDYIDRLIFPIVYATCSSSRTEYDWSDSPGITPYKLVDAASVRMKFGRTGSTDSDVPSTPTPASTTRVKHE